MKLITLCSTICFSFLSFVHASSVKTIEKEVDSFVIYDDFHNSDNRQFAPSGWMPDGKGVFIDEEYYEKSSEGTCIYVKCDIKKSTEKWVAVYWLPKTKTSNPWDARGLNLKKTLNLQPSDRIVLRFRAKGKTIGEAVNFFSGGKFAPAKNPDSTDKISVHKDHSYISLMPVWTEYEIELTGHDVSHLAGIFGFETNEKQNYSSNSIEFFLDNIRIEKIINHSAPPEKMKRDDRVYVYDENQNKFKHLWIPAGFMPDGRGLSLEEDYSQDPHTGKTCIKVQADIDNSSQGWAAVYWLPRDRDPWKAKGYDLTKKLNLEKSDNITLHFWAKSEQAGELVRFSSCGSSADSTPEQISTDFIALTKNWKHYSIDLSGKDLSSVAGPFVFETKDNVIFYLDEIYFEKKIP